MKNIIPDDWDTIFFEQIVSYKEINTILGFKYPYYEDVAQRFVFVKNGRVVYHEDAYPNTGDTQDDRLILKIADSVNYKSFEKKMLFSK